MGFEQQYYGMDLGYKLKAPGAVHHAREAWPHAEPFLLVSELLFGVVFTVEVLAKVAVLQQDFFKSLWNLYDSLMVMCWIVQSFQILHIPTDPLVMRMARIGRLLRLLRFVKAFQVFDVLHLLIRSVQACTSALVWSGLCLVLVMMGTAIILICMLQPELENESIPLEERLKLYRYFGTFTSGLFTMYELTMANWVPVARTVVDNAGDGYILFFVIYRTLVGFAVLTVVTAIFNAETFRVTQSDDDVMLLHKERQIAIHARRMRSLLLEADQSHDGVVNLEEFQSVMSDPKIKKWLLAQDIELRDVELAFKILDESGDGWLTLEELMRGLSKMKGTARSSDMVSILHALSRVEVLIDSISGVLVNKDAGAALPERVLSHSVSTTFFGHVESAL
eukprot:TRINITY_DN7812_c0_g2_i1.p1 TRINITY_DN7812_c0_g2~~TRINITY_DN7812_c0_g2_i1.p1  ORF type:complete len:393 (-),score=35.80 TRINITY_DN7812_c0_g2_i1:133-1311(-)